MDNAGQGVLRVTILSVIIQSIVTALLPALREVLSAGNTVVEATPVPDDIKRRLRDAVKRARPEA